MPPVIRKAYHPAHGGAVPEGPRLGSPVPDAPRGQPSFASAPTAPPRRADPAPSRWAYKMTRLMLTPLFRVTLWLGLPLFLLGGLATYHLADETRRGHLIGVVTDLRQAIETRPEFMVQVMKIEGASADVAQDIHEILPVNFPESSFNLNLDYLRGIVAALDPVDRVQMRVQPGGTLLVQVTERVPALVWRSEAGLQVIDAEGYRVGPLASRADRSDLPLIAGAGADEVTEEALLLLAAAAPVADRLRGLVRIGERRWDVVLDGGQRILLPVEAPVAALERVLAMDAALEILSRDVAVVDVRLGQRPTLRLRANAVEELRRIRAVQFEAGAE